MKDEMFVREKDVSMDGGWTKDDDHAEARENWQG
ncbi:MAG: hypothetical protein ACI8T1_000839 [Verrucomicrobiales bacterium]|jgi:hypothetical protein